MNNRRLAILIAACAVGVIFFIVIVAYVNSIPIHSTCGF